MSASEEQILSALPMVRRVASRYASTSLGAEDAVGVGALALVEAGRRYDPGRGIPFPGYAFRRVNGAMQDACRARGPLPGSVEVPEASWDPDKLDTLFADPHGGFHEGYVDLVAAVAGLRLRLRTVVVQHAAGVPHSQIARHLGVHESRVSQLLGTARRQLRLATAVR